jgi:hypothetical protein
VESRKSFSHWIPPISIEDELDELGTSPDISANAVAASINALSPVNDMDAPAGFTSLVSGPLDHMR